MVVMEKGDSINWNASQLDVSFMSICQTITKDMYTKECCLHVHKCACVYACLCVHSRPPIGALSLQLCKNALFFSPEFLRPRVLIYKP